VASGGVRFLQWRLPQIKRSAAKAAFAGLVGTDSSQEVDLAKGWPEDVCEIELAMHALPEKETRQTDFAARSNNQIGIGQIRRIEIAADCLGRDPLDSSRQ
jgi:hypothetical protein